MSDKSNALRIIEDIDEKKPMISVKLAHLKDQEVALKTTLESGYYFPWISLLLSI